jgi:hypothetical protein
MVFRRDSVVAYFSYAAAINVRADSRRYESTEEHPQNHCLHLLAGVSGFGLCRQSDGATATLSISDSMDRSLRTRQKNPRPIREFDDIPKVLIDAVTAGEDQKFFHHHGLERRF